jgi:uncharacterized protein
MRRVRLLAVGGSLVGWLAVAACCSAGEMPGEVTRQAPIVPLDTGTVLVMTGTDTFRVSVEVARTHEQQSIGLMERSSLGADEGMLFVYDEPRPPDASFYMFRTRIPLDIAFVDEASRIVAIRGMEPCTSPVARACPQYSPGVPYSAALEVNRGYFQARGVSAGDRVVLDTLPASP